MLKEGGKPGGFSTQVVGSPQGQPAVSLSSTIFQRQGEDEWTATWNLEKRHTKKNKMQINTNCASILPELPQDTLCCKKGMNSRDFLQLQDILLQSG